MNKTIIEKLRMAQVSSCSCLTKTPEPSWHDESCSYRVLSEAVTAIAQVTALQDRITSLHHVGMELTGVIDEYRAMPCFSLQQRMFSTADRYRLRLTAKCQTCKNTDPRRHTR